MSLDPLLGRVVDGRFRIEKLLGRGGMGVVYEARQLQVDRVVALKVVRPERARDARAREALLAEARAVSCLTSPHTVTLIDAGTLDEGVFIAMELLSGHTLHDRLASPIDRDDALWMADQLALSLSEAHARGIVHRDLKPLNVMLVSTPGHRETVKVVDFGLAAHAHAEIEAVGGTPRYMAPETLTGAAPDPRGDVYALGLILYEMLAGSHPFERLRGRELVAAHLGLTPPPLPEDVPPALRGLVMRCLAKDARLRPANGEAFRRGLREAAGLPFEVERERVNRRSSAEQEMLATRPSTLSLGDFRPPKPRRRPWWLAVALLVGVAVAWQLRESQEVARTGFAIAPVVLPVAEAMRLPLPEPPPAEQLVDLLVHTIPDGATVVVDGELVGESPVSLRVRRGSRPRLVLTRRGYHPAKLEVTVDETQRIRHVFRRLPAPPVDPMQRRVDHYLD